MLTTTETPLGTLLMRATGWLMDHPDTEVIGVQADDRGVTLHLAHTGWDAVTDWVFDRHNPPRTWGPNGEWTDPALDWYTAEEDGITIIISRALPSQT